MQELTNDALLVKMRIAKVDVQDVLTQYIDLIQQEIMTVLI